MAPDKQKAILGASRTIFGLFSRLTCPREPTGQSVGGYDVFEQTEITGNELIKQAQPGSFDSGIRHFFGSMRFMPISPQDHLYLTVHGHGDDARFACIFRDAWFKILRGIGSR